MRTLVPKKREEVRRATKQLEIVWIDLFGPVNVTSCTGNQYMLDIVDDYTSFVFSIPLAMKDQAYCNLRAWKLEVEREMGDRVKMYSVDNGTELKSGQVEAWLKEMGTQQ